MKKKLMISIVLSVLVIAFNPADLSDSHYTMEPTQTRAKQLSNDEEIKDIRPLFVEIVDEPRLEIEKPTTGLRVREVSRPMIALTFDDGPSVYTDQIRESLEAHHGRATFFVQGRRISHYPDVLRRLADSGFEVVGHSWDHSNLTTLSANQIEYQLNATHAEIESIIGPTPRLYRPPYGAINQTVIDVSAELGFSLIRWSIDPEDWRTNCEDAIYNHIMANARDGGIVVLHDVYLETAVAMERVIPALVEQGFQLVTVSELFYYSEITPYPGMVYPNWHDGW